MIRTGNMMVTVRILIADPPPSQIPKCGKPTGLWGGVMWLVMLVMLVTLVMLT